MGTTERKEVIGKFWKSEQTKALDRLIEQLVVEMEKEGVNSTDYGVHMVRLKELHKIKAKSRSGPISRDTIVMVAGNLLGILVIVAYEQKHVMTSKGFSQIIRPNTPK